MSTCSNPRVRIGQIENRVRCFFSLKVCLQWCISSSKTALAQPPPKSTNRTKYLDTQALAFEIWVLNLLWSWFSDNKKRKASMLRRQIWGSKLVFFLCSLHPDTMFPPSFSALLLTSSSVTLPFHLTRAPAHLACHPSSSLPHFSHVLLAFACYFLEYLVYFNHVYIHVPV